MEKNKTVNYLKYAIGEIVLVVIGILIALSINDWNSNRILLVEEDALYKRIIIDLAIDDLKVKTELKDLKAHQNVHFQIFKESQRKVKHDTNIPYRYLRWTKNYDPIATDKYSKPVSNLSNVSLRSSIEEYFIYENKTKIAIVDWNNIKRNLVRPYLRRKGIFNTDVVFHKPPFEFFSIARSNIVNYDSLKAQYGTKELDQILFDLGVKTSYAISTLDSLLYKNMTLSKILKNKLDLKK